MKKIRSILVLSMAISAVIGVGAGSAQANISPHGDTFELTPTRVMFGGSFLENGFVNYMYEVSCKVSGGTIQTSATGAPSFAKLPSFTECSRNIPFKEGETVGFESKEQGGGPKGHWAITLGSAKINITTPIYEGVWFYINGNLAGLQTSPSHIWSGTAKNGTGGQPPVVEWSGSFQYERVNFGNIQTAVIPNVRENLIDVTHPGTIPVLE